MKSSLLTLAAATLALAGASVAADAATLRSNVIIEGDVIRLGDIFDDAGPYADRPVLNAPAPGRRATLTINWLMEAARVYRVEWRPLSRFDRVVIERAGKTVTGAEIVEYLRVELEREGMPKNAHVELANRSFALHLPLDTPTTVDIRNVSYETETGRFNALVSVGGEHTGAQRALLVGRAFRASPVAVLRRSIGPGEIIRKDDVEIVYRRDDQVARDVVTDAARLVGTTPRGRLRAGEPVRESETRPPLLVARNSQVIIRLAHGPMTLTAQGRAEEDGARGDVIRVKNLQSGKTIEATVQSPDVVAVTLAPRVALN
jgi:flagella basal body P-ring formation protein FlgA